MPSPFPGMDPYLEHPEIWPGVHHWLIIAIADVLVPQLRPKYRVAVEVRTYATSGVDSLLVGIPDVTVRRSQQRSQSEANQTLANLAVATPPATPVTVKVPMPLDIREGYLEVREVETREVVTAIELLSPGNKRAGKGRKVYEEKRQKVLGSQTHLVEIDLLRSGDPLPVLGAGVQSNYRILVSRSDCRPQADLYGFNLPDEIPAFRLPLRSEDSEPTVDLQALLGQVYDRAGYDLAIDYSRDPVPPLSKAETTWTNHLLQK